MLSSLLLPASQLHFGLIKVKLLVSEPEVISQVDSLFELTPFSQTLNAYGHAITRNKADDFVFYDGEWSQNFEPKVGALDPEKSIQGQKGSIIGGLKESLEHLGLTFVGNPENVTPNKFHVSI